MLEAAYNKNCQLMKGRNMNDLTNFKKLSAKHQEAIIKAFIKTFPKEQQTQMRKELLG